MLELRLAPRVFVRVFVRCPRQLASSLLLPRVSLAQLGGAGGGVSGRQPGSELSAQAARRHWGCHAFRPGAGAAALGLFERSNCEYSRSCITWGWVLVRCFALRSKSSLSPLKGVSLVAAARPPTQVIP